PLGATFTDRTRVSVVVLMLNPPGCAPAIAPGAQDCRGCSALRPADHADWRSRARELCRVVGSGPLSPCDDAAERLQADHDADRIASTRRRDDPRWPFVTASWTAAIRTAAPFHLWGYWSRIVPTVPDRRTSMSRKLLVLSGLLLVMGASADAKDKVKVGFIGPLTGGVSVNGLGGRNSADLAVRLRNAETKPKYSYEMVVLDDECKPNVAVQVATKMAAD